MQVKELMIKSPELIDAGSSIRDVSVRMMEQSRNFVPIAEEGQLVGVVTDRDIAARAMGEGKSPEDSISSVMTDRVLYCYDDEDIRDVFQNLGEQQVKQLVVLSRAKEFVGIVNLADIALHYDPAGSRASGDRQYH